MTVVTIAAALGAKRAGRGWMAHCPAHADNTPSLSLDIGHDGTVLAHCHAGCAQDAVIAALGDRGLWNSGSAFAKGRTVANSNGCKRSQVDKPSSSGGASELAKTKSALTIWASARDPRGTGGELYLNRRGLQLTDSVARDVLRFQDALVFNGRRVPGLVALFRDVFTDEPAGIQRIFLQHNGERIGRRMLGRIRGAVIKLDGNAHVSEGLHIGEGLESCLAARALGFRPVWAVGSAGGIRNFPVLPGIEALSILRETDDQGANEHAANACAERWLEASREVLAVTPMLVGDMNDVLRCAYDHDHEDHDHEERGHDHGGDDHDQ